jgi:5S rRNA maturation endonuclease (ribonuclease M5)
MVNAQGPIRQEEYKALDIISRFAPRGFRTNANPRSRYMMACPLPDHDDNQHRDNGGSFSINEEETLWICFGCGEKGNARKLHEILAGQLLGPRVREPGEVRRQAPAPAPARKNIRKPLQGVTIAQLADAKNLNADYLYDELAWRDVKYFNTSAISMPYASENNDDVQVRFRVGLDDRDRFRWDRGSVPRLYGLWNLESIKAQSFVILVEGETDYATLDYHGFPVLGVPGSQNYKSEWNQHFSDVRDIYVWKEPDTGGEKLVERLQIQFPQIKVITPPPGIKDPCDLATQAGDGFREMMDDLLDGAVAPPAPHRDQEIRTSFISSENKMEWNNFGFVLDQWMTGKKQQVVDFLEQAGAKEAHKAAMMKLCYDYYVFKKCQNTGDVAAHRVRCGDPSCMACATWLIKSFLDSKEQLLRDGMEQPTLYRVYLFSQRLHADRDLMADDFADIYKRIRQMLTRLTDSQGKERGLAKDHLYGIRTKIVGDIAHFEVVLMGDYARENVEILTRHFQRQTGVASTVEERRTHGVLHACELFASLMAVRVDWDTPETYLAWRLGTKGAKLIQGKGAFYRVSGGSKGAKLTLEQMERRVGAECRICGSCSPVQLHGYHAVVGTAVRQVTSPYTGSVYLEPVQYVAELYGEEPAEGYAQVR